MARQSGRQYDVTWDSIMDDRIYNKKGHQSDKEQAEVNIGTFGRRPTNSNRSNRNSDYLQLMDYQAGGSQYSLNDPSVAYSNAAFSHEQFPAGRYKKHMTFSESTSDRCSRPCRIAVVGVVLFVALVAAGVGLYFGLFRHETPKATSAPATLTAYSTELRLTDLTWNSKLEDPTSPEFASMKSDVQSDLAKIMRHSSLQSKYQSAEVTGFSSGSIKVQCLLKLLTDALSAIDVKSSFVQSYNSIDKVTLTVTKSLDTTTLTISVTQSTANTTTVTVPATITRSTVTTTKLPTTATPHITTTPPTTTRPTTTTTPPTTTKPTTTTRPTTTTTLITHDPPIPTTIMHNTIPTSTTPTTTTTPTTNIPTTTTTTTTKPTTTPTTTTTKPTSTPTTTTTTTPTSTPTTTTTIKPTTTPTTTTTTKPTTTPTTTTTTKPTTTPNTTTTTTPTTTTTSMTTTTTLTTTTPTTTTTNPTTTITTIPTTAGPTTPAVCRNGTLAVPLLFQCFDFQVFSSKTTDADKCTYLTGVGNCLEVKIETTYNVDCSYSDQLVIINSFASIVAAALNFDLVSVCNFQKR